MWVLIIFVYATIGQPTVALTSIPMVTEAACQAIEQAEKQEPSRAQTKQIVEGLKHCHHPDSQHEFLRVWIRDWTAHKSAPPRKEWVGLTDEEVVACWARPDLFAIAHAIEAKLKEKNT